MTALFERWRGCSETDTRIPIVNEQYLKEAV